MLEINKQSVAISWSDILLKWYYFGISELAFTKHLDPQHKFNEQKTFIWHPWRDMNILLMFNLDCITTGSSVTQLLAVKVSFDYFSSKQIKKNQSRIFKFWLKKVIASSSVWCFYCYFTHILNLFGISILMTKDTFKFHALHKKWSFPLRISPVNVTKSAVSCGFGHIYRRNA